VAARFSAIYIELARGKEAIRIAPRHFVYMPEISTHFDTYYLPVVPSETNGVSLVDYSQPSLHTYRRSGLQFELAAFPEEDEAIEGYFYWYTPKEGDIVFDIGAHCGISTYRLAKLVGPSGRVIAFEPDPVNHSILVRNIHRHKLENVTCVKTAISDSRGTALFNCEGAIGSGLARHLSRATVGTVEKVETMTLADAFTEFGVPSFCKIDIEGAEISVLASAFETLSKLRVQFALDTNHLVDGSLTNGRVEQEFVKCGYEVLSLPISGMMTTWARPQGSAG
jgi:FkbM family methyltransferase